MKFKLEVGVTETDLLAIAEESRRQSRADLMVANTLEGMHAWAFIGDAVKYDKIARADLSARLVESVEALNRRRQAPHAGQPQGVSRTREVSA